MSHSLTHRLLVTSTAFLLSLIAGCAGKEARPPAQLAGPASFIAMDTMDHWSSVDADSSFVILTMENRIYDRLLKTRGRGRGRQAEVQGTLDYFLSDMESRHGLVLSADWPLGSLGVRCLVFEATEPLADADIAALPSSDSRVETAQRMNGFQVLASSYDDPYLELQHSLEAMQVESSHRWATGKGITVAVIDTGMDLMHPDLRDQTAGWRSFVGDKGAGFSDDIHGTAVGGVIAASANNGVGIVGVAPNARLLALKGCWQKSSESSAASCSTFTLAKAINFAIDKRPHVLNLSLVGPEDPLLERLVKTALKQGITVVGASKPDNAKQFPAYVDGVIGVSEDGHNTPMAVVSAPGRKILSAQPGGDFDFYSGSSMSAAHVSGLAALIKERKPKLSPDAVLSVIKAATKADRDTNSIVSACTTLAQLTDGVECGGRVATKE